MKRTPAPSVKLNPNDVETIVSTVFETVEARLDPRFYLLDVNFEKELGAWFLRIYIEGLTTPVSLNDCADVSQALEPHIDVLKPLQNFPYSLEISSPGLFRPLKTAREFAFYAGRPIRVTQQGEQTVKKSKAALQSAQELASGTLIGFDEATRQVSIQQAADSTVDLPLTANTQVFLNPTIHFPETEESSNGNDVEVIKFINQEISEESHD